jgi:hypothetical protein
MANYAFFEVANTVIARDQVNPHVIAEYIGITLSYDLYNFIGVFLTWHQRGA